MDAIVLYALKSTLAYVTLTERSRREFSRDADRYLEWMCTNVTEKVATEELIENARTLGFARVNGQLESRDLFRVPFNSRATIGQEASIRSTAEDRCGFQRLQSQILQVSTAM